MCGATTPVRRSAVAGTEHETFRSRCGLCHVVYSRTVSLCHLRARSHLSAQDSCVGLRPVSRQRTSPTLNRALTTVTPATVLKFSCLMSSTTLYTVLGTVYQGMRMK